MLDKAVISLQPEYLPASGDSQQQVVLLHGWGSNREVWRPMLASLRPWANVTLLDLPGLAPGLGDEIPQLDELIAAIAAASPGEAVFLGWSLGGQLASEVARCYPGRVQALVTLCSNPRFWASDEWPGMQGLLLEQFTAACVEDPAAILRRFDSLQVAGIARPRPVLRSLRELRPAQAGTALVAGLQWLAQLDQRQSLRELDLPQLHLLAESDGLLPGQLAGAMDQLLEGKEWARVQTVPHCGHPVPLQAGPGVAAALRQFLLNVGVGGSPKSAPPRLNKDDVAQSFSRAAQQYDSVAQLQRDVGTELLSRLDDLALEPADVLDLGSGTGYFCPALKNRFPGANYLGLDLAEGMARYAREHFPEAGDWMVADAEALPLASGSVDLVFSSLAVQWCYRPELLYAELARVLRPGGRCVFTSLGPKTLHELRSAWAVVDQHQHVNEFLPMEALVESARRIPGIRLELDVRPYRMEYQQVRQLLNELKTLGAHNVNRHRPSGLTGRRALQGMLRAYETWREDDVLPASYEVYFGTLEKR